MTQRVAAFFSWSLEDLCKDIENGKKKHERIAQISHSQATSYDNHTNRGSQVYHYFSAVVVYEKKGSKFRELLQRLLRTAHTE